METTWLLVHLVIFCQVEQFLCDEENGDFEMLPQPAAVASPERSGFDENQFKKQFSIPHHLVPSFGDVSGAVNKDQSPDTQENRELPEKINYSFNHRPLIVPSSTVPSSQPDFYDYYDYAEVNDDAREEHNIRRSQQTFFPEVSFSDPKVRERPGKDELRERLENHQNFKEDQSSFSDGSWVKPPRKINNKHRDSVAGNVRPDFPNSRPSRRRPRPGLLQPPRHQHKHEQRRRRPSPSSGHTQNQGNFLSHLVQGVRNSLTDVFYGKRRVSLFPRIQYGPLDFGPPLSQLPYEHDYSFRHTSRDDHNYYDYEDDDLYDYYETYDEYRPRKKNSNRRYFQEENDVHESNGHLDVVHPVKNKFENSNSQRQKFHPREKQDKVDTPQNIAEDQETEDYLENHKFGEEYEYIEEDDDEDKEFLVKQQQLQDLLDYVNGKKNSVNREKPRNTIDLGVQNVVSEDYGDLFDDVIETTSDNDIDRKIAWLQQTEKVADSLPDHKKRQKIKIKKYKKPSFISTTPRTEKPHKRDDAKILSIWAAAEKVAENGPSLRFDESSQEEFNQQFTTLQPQLRTVYTPTPKTVQFSDNFRGFNKNIETVNRKYFGDFKPSTFDASSSRVSSSDLNPSSSIRDNHVYNNHHNHGSSSYDQKMIIDLPAPTQASLPPASNISMRHPGMSLQTPFHQYSPPTSPIRTKTLQKLTLGL